MLFGQFLKQADHFTACTLIKVAGRFIGKQHCGMHAGGARNRHALSLSARELVRPVIGAIQKAIVLQQFCHAHLAVS